MVRFIIAGPVYVEYEASSLEYQIEDYLAEIGTALGPMEITDAGNRCVECEREVWDSLKGYSVLYRLCFSHSNALYLVR